MPEKSLVIRLIGDSRSLEQSFKRSARAAEKFKRDVESGGVTTAISSQTAAVKDLTAAEATLVKVRARRGGSLGPFRLAGVGLAAGIGINAAVQGARALAASLETTGKAAYTTTGRIKNMTAALAGGDVVGAIQSLTKVQQTTEDIGVKAGDWINPAKLAAFRKFATMDVPDLYKNLQKSVQAFLETDKAMKQTELQTARLRNEAAKLGSTYESISGDVVTFKGAVDDLARPRGPGAFPQGTSRTRSTYPAVPYSVTANERARRGNAWFDARVARQLDILQDRSLRNQLEGLRVVEAQLRARLAVTNDATRQLALQDQIRGINREQLSIQEQIGDQIKKQNQELKARADAIKSAVIERLQQKQTDILNKRALADAQEQLRIALQQGGPRGILEARRGIQDVRMDILLAKIQRQPASLTAGGMFSLGNVITINIHGVTDPQQVANRVAAVLARRGKHTSQASRGPTAGSATGQK